MGWAGSDEHRELGLTDPEYELIVDKLGREPNEVELAVFSLMWSEHCGYKHSRRLLKTLPTEGPQLVLGPGENAGAVDVGGGMAAAFKVESHNHPSAVEPFQGAATGVGGILRDVFAIGARPIAILDSLRFGEPSSQRSRYLLEHAVAGIGHYGNSIGVATVGGEIYFEGPYEQNCLVNAMCVGLIETSKLIKSAAAGVGNVVVLFGARTGRDGIGGASVLASAELGDEDSAKRPTVQIGDPFEESKLLECSLELLDRALLVALQDLGAAGLTSSSSEMAAKGGVGIDLDVRRVPLREADMEPFEIMISESQERMLCVVEPERVDDVLAVCAKWEVNATAIGEVTSSDRLRVFDGEALVGDLPVSALVDECPAYDLEPLEPSRPLYPAPEAVLAGDLSAGDTLLGAAGQRQPRVAPVGVRAVRLRRRLAHRAPPRAGRRGRAHARPRRRDRGVDRRQRPARGGRPVPRRGRGRARVLGQPRLRRRGAAGPDQLPELRQSREAAHRLAAHARGRRPRRRLPCARRAGRRRQRLALQRGRRRPDLPDARRRHGRRAARPGARPAGWGSRVAGDAVALISASWAPSEVGSELAKLRGEPLWRGRCPSPSSAQLRALHAAIRQAVRSGALRSAHDVAEGGVAVALAECCIAGGIGASVALDGVPLFAEGPGAFVVSGPPRR